MNLLGHQIDRVTDVSEELRATMFRDKQFQKRHRNIPRKLHPSLFLRETKLLKVLGSNPGEDKIFSPIHTGPGAHPASCTMGFGSL